MAIHWKEEDRNIFWCIHCNGISVTCTKNVNISRGSSYLLKISFPYLQPCSLLFQENLLFRYQMNSISLSISSLCPSFLLSHTYIQFQNLQGNSLPVYEKGAIYFTHRKHWKLLKTGKTCLVHFSPVPICLAKFNLLGMNNKFHRDFRNIILASFSKDTGYFPKRYLFFIIYYLRT